MFFVFAEQDQRRSAQVSAALSTTGDTVILNVLFIHTSTICNGYAQDSKPGFMRVK